MKYEPCRVLNFDCSPKEKSVQLFFKQKHFQEYFPWRFSYVKLLKNLQLYKNTLRGPVASCQACEANERTSLAEGNLINRKDEWKILGKNTQKINAASLISLRSFPLYFNDPTSRVSPKVIGHTPLGGAFSLNPQQGYQQTASVVRPNQITKSLPGRACAAGPLTPTSNATLGGVEATLKLPCSVKTISGKSLMPTDFIDFVNQSLEIFAISRREKSAPFTPKVSYSTRKKFFRLLSSASLARLEERNNNLQHMFFSSLDGKFILSKKSKVSSYTDPTYRLTPLRLTKLVTNELFSQ